ncbi:MAG: hypothetical protein ACTSRP_05620 [Candidatus Helarchaeota archaeon]
MIKNLKNRIVLYSYIFNILLVISIIIYFCSDFYSFLILLFQIACVILSILGLYIYLKELDCFFQIKKIPIILAKDPDWHKIRNLLDSISISNSKSIKIRIMILKIILISCAVSILISVMLNSIIALNFIFFLIPISIVILFGIIIQFPKNLNGPLIDLKKTILDFYFTFIGEFNQLQQFKINGTEEYFNLVESRIIELNENIDQLKNLKLDTIKSKIQLIILINENYNNVFKFLIEKIYELRGMLSTLMTIIIKIKENHFVNYKKMELVKWNEREQTRLTLIKEKEARLLRLKNLINNDIKEALQDLENKKKEINNFSNKIIEEKKKYLTEKFTAQFNLLTENGMKMIESFNKMVNDSFFRYISQFEELNKKIRNNYNLLKSELARLSFEKFYQDLMKMDPMNKFSEQFYLIADLFFIDLIEDLDSHDLIPILERICRIHDNIENKTPNKFQRN